MESTSYNEEVFTINVHNKRYYVEPICNNDHCTHFKISTSNEYMFTLCMDENGDWQPEQDVIPIDKTLIDDIGRAIEEHDVH